MRKSSSILILVSATQQGSLIHLIQIPKPIRNRQDRTGQAAVTNMAVILASSSFLTCSKSLQGPRSQTQWGSHPCWGKLRHPYCRGDTTLGQKELWRVSHRQLHVLSQEYHIIVSSARILLAKEIHRHGHAQLQGGEYHSGQEGNSRWKN